MGEGEKELFEEALERGEVPQLPERIIKAIYEDMGWSGSGVWIPLGDRVTVTPYDTLELLRTESKLYTIEFLNACRTYCENIDRESAYKRLIQKYEEWESSVIYFMKYIYELEEQGEEKL